MRNRIDLYSHASSMSNKVHAETLWLQIKKAYAIKSYLLIFALPLDMLAIIFLLISKRKFECIFVTLKWQELIRKTSRKSKVSVVAAPNAILFCIKNNIGYIPASFFYILASIGVWLPRRFKGKWSLLAVKLTSQMLNNFINHDSTLIVHSDALPFGRCLVMAGKELGLTTVCIQHGNFREYNIVSEQDGFLCNINITRSNEDSEIIKKSNPATTLMAIPDFFLLCTKDSKMGSSHRVLLLGEGFHMLDKDFNKLYIEQLQYLEIELEKIGLEVLFRPHPSERNMNWNSKFHNVDSDDLIISMAKTSAIIGFSSTLLQEAAEIEIPAFYIDPLQTGHQIVGRNNAIIRKYIDAKQVYSASYSCITSLNNNFLNKKRLAAIELVANLISGHK